MFTFVQDAHQQQTEQTGSCVDEEWTIIKDKNSKGWAEIGGCGR